MLRSVVSKPPASGLYVDVCMGLGRTLEAPSTRQELCMGAKRLISWRTKFEKGKKGTFL